MVKDRAINGIGANESSTLEWQAIDWQAVERKIRNLRQRIFRATQCGQWNKVRSLMKLMLRSYCNLLNSVRKITLINSGRKTPGIDRHIVLTDKRRVNLVKSMLKSDTWKAHPARRVYIPKANGNTTPTLLQNSASAGLGSGKAADTKRHINAIFAYVDFFHKRPNHVALCLPI